MHKHQTWAFKSRLSGYRIEQEFDRYGKQTDLHQPVKPDAHEV
jgi:hypothetical protein